MKSTSSLPLDQDDPETYVEAEGETGARAGANGSPAKTDGTPERSTGVLGPSRRAREAQESEAGDLEDLGRRSPPSPNGNGKAKGRSDTKAPDGALHNGKPKAELNGKGGGRGNRARPPAAGAPAPASGSTGGEGTAAATKAPPPDVPAARKPQAGADHPPSSEGPGEDAQGDKAAPQGNAPAAGGAPPTGAKSTIHRPLTRHELRQRRRRERAAAPVSETVQAVRKAARQRTFRRRRITYVSLAVVLVVAGFLALWYRLQADPGSRPGEMVLLDVSKGENSGTVINQVVKDGVVTSGLAYHFYLFFHTPPNVQPGSYALRQDMSFGEVNATLAGGPNVTPFTIPAGLTLGEIAARVGQMPGVGTKAFLAAVQSGKVRSPWEAAGSTNLEGLLAPGRYGVLPGEGARAVVQEMVDRFDRQAAAMGVTPQQAARLGVTPNQLVTVASIVQKEGYLQSNMPQVSRVIYNRLSKQMPLQMDSTILYSLGRDGGQVTAPDLRVDTPYNTYLHAGLPPTPVAAPSLAALRAAGHPPAGSWLYFVLIDKKGDEAFTNSYQQQLANEELARSRGLS